MILVFHAGGLRGDRAKKYIIDLIESAISNGENPVDAEKDSDTKLIAKYKGLHEPGDYLLQARGLQHQTLFLMS